MVEHAEVGGGKETAGDFGFARLGKSVYAKGIGGSTVGYSYNPSAEDMQRLAQEYLDTGRFNNAGKEYIAKAIAKDLNARGAGVHAEKSDLVGQNVGDVVKFSLSKKDGKWHAKISNAQKKSSRDIFFERIERMSK